jgi:2-isopropylmalate synthase
MQDRSILIYDTTLRDGTQGEGVSLSLQDKLNIAVRLSEIGIEMIEGGFSRRPKSSISVQAFWLPLA